MSERGKKSRADGREKARRLSGGTDPHQKVDASSWEPGAPMNTTAKTGQRPINPRTYKAGGRIQGDRGPRRADKAPRQPAEVSAKINRDVKVANAELGKPHIGGMKKGGRAHKMGGGPLDPNTMVLTARLQNMPNGRMPIGGLKRGGKATPPGDGPGMKAGDRVPRARGGGTKNEYSVPGARGGDIRKSPSYGVILQAIHERGPTQAAAHAELARRGLWLNDEQIKQSGFKSSPAAAPAAPSSAPTPAASDDRTPRKSGGRAKGKTNINIVIGQPGGAQAQAMPGPIKPPPAPPPMPMGGPPPGMPPGMGAGPPPGPPPSMAGMPPPPQMRKSGGRTLHLTGGAGGAKGRLEKAHFEARKG